MGIVRRKLSDLPPLTPEQNAWREAHAKDPNAGLDYPDLAGWTAEERARSTRTSDYPSAEDADEEAAHLADLQEAGMGVKELEAYKESRIKRLAAV
jgi:hypothetical protein